MKCPHPDCEHEFEPVYANPQLCPKCQRKLTPQAVATARRGSNVAAKGAYKSANSIKPLWKQKFRERD